MPKTILIIDDEDDLRELYVSELKSSGFNILEAKDGEEGLSMALSKKPDLITLDMKMPKMDGMMVLRKLREDEWGKSAKVIILTNMDDGSALSEAVEHGLIESGINDYLLKMDWKPGDLTKRAQEKLEA